MENLEKAAVTCQVRIFRQSATSAIQTKLNLLKKDEELVSVIPLSGDGPTLLFGPHLLKGLSGKTYRG